MSGILWPVPEKFAISQGFGRPALVVEPTMWLETDDDGKDRRCKPDEFKGAKKFQDVHPAVDISCPVGTALVAPADGRIVGGGIWRVFNPYTKKFAFEKYLMQRIHRCEKDQTIAYLTHLSQVRFPIGTKVTRGQKIGETGESGIVTGAHLHFEIRVGPADDAPQQSWSWFRWNPWRLRVGGDLSDKEFVS